MEDPNKLAEDHVSLAMARANRAFYQTFSQQANLSDLQSSAMFGLVQASRSWDGRGSFVGWACRRIDGQIFDDVRKDSVVSQRDHRKGVRVQMVSGSMPITQDGEYTVLNTFIDQRRNIVTQVEARLLMDRVKSLPRPLARMKVMELCGFTQEEIAESEGISAQQVYRTLRHLVIP